MPTTLNERKSNNDDLGRKAGVGIFVIPIVALIAVLILGLRHPAVSTWISEAAQAEFVGTTGPSSTDMLPAAERILHAARER